MNLYKYPKLVSLTDETEILVRPLRKSDNVVRVPLMISHDSIEPGVDRRIVSTVDLFPTVLSLLGLDAPEDLCGMNVLAGDRDAAYSEHWISSSDGITRIVNRLEE